MAKRVVISTPRGAIYVTKGGNAKLEWNGNFGQNRTKQFMTAQQFIDSEVLRLDAPYMPIQTGTLIKSGILGTVVGSGEVRYIAPYAAPQYYRTSDTRSYDAQRGAHWFERMKIDHRDEILRGAARKLGGVAGG